MKAKSVVQILIDEIVSCASEEDGGKRDAKVLCHQLVNQVRQETLQEFRK